VQKSKFNSRHTRCFFPLLRKPTNAVDRKGWLLGSSNEFSRLVSQVLIDLIQQVKVITRHRVLSLGVKRTIHTVTSWRNGGIRFR
jgi:hypothetical protein